jgi:hypothetical protein
MRGTFYVWGDGENIHINDVVMPDDVFDQLVAMRWAQMTEEEKEAAKRAAVENYSGNFGCTKLCEEMGVPSALDWVNDLAERMRKENGV